MKGNVNDLKDLMGCEFETPVVALAEVKTVEKDGETKEYQAIYNRAFLPEYTLKQFRLIDYTKPDTLKSLAAKKDLKIHEKFILQVTGEYGTKNFTILKPLMDYDPSMNLVASNAPIEEGDPSY
jgi:hypothetical protein